MALVLDARFFLCRLYAEGIRFESCRFMFGRSDLLDFGLYLLGFMLPSLSIE